MYGNSFMLSTVFNTQAPRSYECSIPDYLLTNSVFKHCASYICAVQFTPDLCPYLDICRPTDQIDNVIYNQSLHCDHNYKLISSMYGLLYILSMMIGSAISTIFLNSRYGPYNLVKYSGIFVIITTVILTIFRNEYRIQLSMQFLMGLTCSIFQFNSLFLANEINGFKQVPFTTLIIGMEPLISVGCSVVIWMSGSMFYWQCLCICNGVVGYVLFFFYIPKSPYQYFQNEDKVGVERIVNQFCDDNDLNRVKIDKLDVYGNNLTEKKNNGDINKIPNADMSRSYQTNKVKLNIVQTIILFIIGAIMMFQLFFQSKQMDLPLSQVNGISGIMGGVSIILNIKSIHILGMKIHLTICYVGFIVSLYAFQTIPHQIAKYILIALISGLGQSIFISVFVVINTQFEEFATPVVMGLCNTVGRLGHLSAPLLGEYVSEPLQFLSAIGAIGIGANLMLQPCRIDKKINDINQ